MPRRYIQAFTLPGDWQAWLSDGLVTLHSVLRLPFPALVLAAVTAPGMSLSACAAPGGNRGAAMATGAAARVTITGLIVNGVTARPLPGAIIDLDNRPRLSETGADGRFRLDDIPVGVHLLGARAQHFRSRLQPVVIVIPDQDGEGGTRNDFIVLLFAPSGYFAGFPPLGSTPVCRNEADCAPGQVCLVTNFKEGDAPVCSAPVHCRSEADCKLGQQCEPVTLMSGEEPHVCQGQPAPEVEQP